MLLSCQKEQMLLTVNNVPLIESDKSNEDMFIMEFSESPNCDSGKDAVIIFHMH